MKGRLITIGDIHGCHLEFAELLRRLELTPHDRVVLLGDLVNRGPDSNRVIELAREHAAVALLGNHEFRLLKYRHTGQRKFLKKGDLETVARLRPEDWRYLEQMPLTFSAPEFGAVFVHGGFLPEIPWAEQTAEIVTKIQVVDRSGHAAKRADAPASPAWADLWRGPPFVVYGHTPRPEVYSSPWAVGIDTACVFGGALTAYILPEKGFIQVRARQSYWS